MSTFHLFAFGIYPYIALAVMFIGTWIRYDREQYTWKASSSQLLEKKWLRIGSIPFHIGIIGIFFGHLVGLLTPVEVWHLLGVSASAKQILAVVAGGLFGVLCLFGLVVLTLRRLFHPRIRPNSKPMDIVVLFLLLAQLLLGLASIFISVGHLDGAVMLQLMHWAQSVFLLRGLSGAEYIVGVHWIFKAHLVLGLTIFLLFPFTRLVHLLSVPVKYLGRNYQVVRRRARASM
ncbi:MULTISPECIES: respiratory nitrate reductase subunit gamma [unclassified Marinimicrobium]|nr:MULTISPECIES: respiratory nitrate reductase subunit gamma [unclassified Marinimicrobium]